MVFVYFIYGLAFFSMGLAILLEVGRADLLAEARALRPLAVFGLLHGLHEWLEIFLLQSEWLGTILPTYWDWLRLSFLAVSFIALVVYGVQNLFPPQRKKSIDIWIGTGLSMLYLAVIVLVGTVSWENLSGWMIRADVLARYLLAVPGAILAAVALSSQARERLAEEQDALSQSLRWAAWGFGLYGFSQTFVAPLNFFPANFWNIELFLRLTRIPVQAGRALIAVVLTTSLIRALQIVEKRRQEQLLAAQQDRLVALEQVQDELLKREEMRRELLQHTVIAQEEERSRIARELHDETAQILTAFSLDVATLQSRECDNPEVRTISKRLQSLSQDLSRGLKRLVHDLRPAQLDDLGLIPALKHLIDEITKRTGLQVKFKTEGHPHRLDPLVETVLYRIAQESLTNIVRHAQTEAAVLELIFKNDRVQMWTRDEGVGFNVGKRHPTQIGWGIAGMRERVRSVRGEFYLISEPGHGTQIEVIIPLNYSGKEAAS
jgi:signal transduction histidine kinase